MFLRIGGLDENTTEDDLMKLFSEIGRVDSVRVIRDMNTGKSKRFAMAQMPVEAEGQAAIKKLHGSILAGNKLMVMPMPHILPGEMDMREWLNDNPGVILRKIGVKEGQAMLDYGCGPGIFSMAGAEIVGKQGKVYALDTRSGALERLKQVAAEKTLSNIETILIDTSRIGVNLPDKSLDVVLFFDVLQEIKDRQGLLKEAYRLLKDEGILSIYPMHIGTEKCLELVKSSALYQFRDKYCPGEIKSASEVLIYTKIS